MKSAVSARRARAASARRGVEATRHARLRSPFSSSSLKTGTNADESAASATSARTRFGIWKAIVNALIGPRRRSSRRRRSRGRGRARARARSRARRSRSRRRAAGRPRRRRGVGRRGRPLVAGPSSCGGVVVRLEPNARAAGGTTGYGLCYPRPRPPDAGIFSRYAEHQAAEEARPHRRRAAAREPALPLDDQDADEAARGGRRGRRRRRGRRPSTGASSADRPRGRARRAAPEHRARARSRRPRSSPPAAAS